MMARTDSTQTYKVMIGILIAIAFMVCAVVVSHHRGGFDASHAHHHDSHDSHHAHHSQQDLANMHASDTSQTDAIKGYWWSPLVHMATCAH
ncbi:hypothetical protein NGM44_01130 [Moraxella sp. FZFQ2102]|uniref:hypothetical protein n=1 Tax=Moraxella sp. FZFQ2102 TaxID=2953752 RepID=UPI00209BC20C|nr:hypothetical protein [Moraxella sp. FZFQ2102]USZ15032.1 hypothetical protein NGM44_01130 [Moraxella sp. FZFQ2102]